VLNPATAAAIGTRANSIRMRRGVMGRPWHCARSMLTCSRPVRPGAGPGGGLAALERQIRVEAQIANLDARTTASDSAGSAGGARPGDDGRWRLDADELLTKGDLGAGPRMPGPEACGGC